ncbi:hypothetical protein PCE1_004053 [Barthelona sp. PCE]
MQFILEARVSLEPTLCRQLRGVYGSSMKDIKESETMFINMSRDLLDNHTYNNKLGADPKNELKNRYCNILPEDSSIVQLSSGYINANHIELLDCSFVATQGPLQNTTKDFWAMVYYYGSLIIGLEHLPYKVHQYWRYPGELEYFKRYRTRIPKDLNMECYVIHFCIKGETAKRVVPFLLDKNWLDYSHPLNRTTLLRSVAMNFVMSFGIVSLRKNDMVRSLETLENAPVIHCSAGVGRTGTLMVLLLSCRYHILKGMLADTSDLEFDIEEVIMNMKKQRHFSMVQLPNQFVLARHFHNSFNMEEFLPHLMQAKDFFSDLLMSIDELDIV